MKYLLKEIVVDLLCLLSENIIIVKIKPNLVSFYSTLKLVHSTLLYSITSFDFFIPKFS
jgi:hypothetical protein